MARATLTRSRLMGGRLLGSCFGVAGYRNSCWTVSWLGLRPRNAPCCDCHRNAPIYTVPALVRATGWLWLEAGGVGLRRCLVAFQNRLSKRQWRWFLRLASCWCSHQSRDGRTCVTLVVKNGNICSPTAQKKDQRKPRKISEISKCLHRRSFNIIKWPMPLGARPRSIKNVNKMLWGNLCVLSMIFLMRVQSFNIVCSLVFHNLYIVHTMKYIFLNYFAQSRLMAVPCIPNGHHTTVAMHHIYSVTKPVVTLLLHCDVTWSVVA